MESTDLENISALMAILRVERLMALALGIAVIYLLAKGVQRISTNLQKSYPSKRVVFLQIATMLNFTLYIFGSISLVYFILRPPKEILLAVAGSAAVAIGISLKDIVASVVAGVILLFDRPFQVGDRVSFNGNYGEIISIGLRKVQLNTLDDNLVTIPNSRFLTDVVASGNAGALDMMIVVDFHLAPDADLDLAKSIVKEITTTSRFAYLKKPVTVLTSEVIVAERIAVKVRAKAYVIDCRFEKAFESDVVSRVLKVFNENSIKRPLRM